MKFIAELMNFSCVTLAKGNIVNSVGYIIINAFHLINKYIDVLNVILPHSLLQTTLPCICKGITRKITFTRHFMHVILLIQPFGNNLAAGINFVEDIQMYRSGSVACKNIWNKWK